MSFGGQNYQQQQKVKKFAVDVQIWIFFSQNHQNNSEKYTTLSSSSVQPFSILKHLTKKKPDDGIFGVE